MRSLLVVIALLAGASTARADECEIPATVSGIEVRVRGQRGHRVVRLRSPTRLVITPLRTGIMAVRGLDDPSLAGTTRAALSFVIARPVSLAQGSVELPAGLPIESVTPSERGPWLRVDAALGDGLYLRRADLPCSALTASTGAVEIVPRESARFSGPRWRARTTRLYVHAGPDDDEGFIRLEVAPDATAVFREIERRTGFLRIALTTGRGVLIRAWARDTSLI